MKYLKEELLNNFIKAVRINSRRLSAGSNTLTRVEKDTWAISQGEKFEDDRPVKLNALQLNYLKNTRDHFVALSKQSTDLLQSPVVLSLIDDDFDLNKLDATFENKLRNLNPAVISKLETLLMNTLNVEKVVSKD